MMKTSSFRFFMSDEREKKRKFGNLYAKKEGININWKTDFIALRGIYFDFYTQKIYPSR